MAKKPYESGYEDRLNGMMDKIINRKEFNYDFNADPLYQNYKDQYTKLGNEAAQNAVANASALTGGYGNTYAATAGAQANQQYLTALNNVIPSLYNNALNQYNAEGNRLKDAYGMLQDAEARKYAQYRDDVADDQWQQSFDENNRQWQQNFDYNKAWNQQNFESDNSWKQKDYDQRLREYQNAVDQWLQTFNYNQGRDAVADQQWRDQFDYSKGRDAVADAQWREQFDYGKGRDTVADQQWQTEFDENLRRWNITNWELLAAMEAAQNPQPVSEGGGGGGEYVEPAATTTTQKSTTTGKKKNSETNDTSNTVEKATSSLYTTPEDRVKTAVINNKLDQAVADAVNEGLIPNDDKSMMDLRNQLARQRSILLR